MPPPQKVKDVQMRPGFPQEDGHTFDYEEKVSVHLVANRGLMVIDDLSCDREVTPEPNQTVNCLKAKSREKCPGHSSKISTKMSPGGILLSPELTSKSYREQQQASDNCGCAFDQKGSGSSYASTVSSSTPFAKTRHGSSSNSGVSSMTPLMGSGSGEQLKESHKIPVVMKPHIINSSGSRIHLYCALVLGFSASLFYSLTLVLAKVLQNRDHNAISISFWKSLGILIPSVPLLCFYLCRGKQKKVLGPVWPLTDTKKAANALGLLMRGVLGSTAVILRFCSLRYLTIGVSSSISYSALVFAAIFGQACLKKVKCGFLPALMGVVVMTGIYIVCEPPWISGRHGDFDTNILKSVVLSTLSMLCTSGMLVLSRHLLRVHFTLILVITGLWGIIESGALAISLNILKVPDLLPDIVLIIGLGILSFFGQLFVLLAVRIVGEAQGSSTVSAIRSCDIFFSFLWQYLFLNESLDIYKLLSTALIVGAVWIICCRNWVVGLRESDKRRQRLALMLH